MKRHPLRASALALTLGGAVAIASWGASSTAAAARAVIAIGVPWPGWYAPYAYWPRPIYAPPPIQYVIPPAVPQAPIPAPAADWYFCETPEGYYPYVMSCNGAWQRIPASPAH